MFSRSLLPTLRATRSQQVRFASSAGKEPVVEAAAEKAKAAGEVAKKHMDSAVAKSGAALKAAVEKAGLGAHKDVVVENFAVAREVLKQVYVTEKLSPPTLAQVSHTYSSFFHSARDASYWRTLLQNGEWKRYGIYALEAYGIFKIGEMIGRRHVVGYSLEDKSVEVAAH